MAPRPPREARFPPPPACFSSRLRPQGTAWVGVASGANATTYNATVGQAVFFPPGAVHWLKNVGGGELAVVLFFGSHEEVKTLDVDEAFFGTAEDIAARALQVKGKRGK